MAERSLLREKREREFQRRVLVALEKPKPNRVLAFLNSRLTLWVTTAVFITFGGAYITRYQQCIADNTALAERYVRLNRELAARRTSIAQIIEQATSLDYLRSALPVPLFGRYIEFQDRTLREMEFDLVRISSRIDFSAVDKLHSHFTKEIQPIQLRDFFRYSNLLYSELDESISPPVEIGELKKIWQTLYLGVIARRKSVEYSEFIPICTPKSLLYNVFYPAVPTLAALPTPGGAFLSKYPNLSDLPKRISNPFLPEPFFKTDPPMFK